MIFSLIMSTADSGPTKRLTNARPRRKIQDVFRRESSLRRSHSRNPAYRESGVCEGCPSAVKLLKVPAWSFSVPVDMLGQRFPSLAPLHSHREPQSKKQRDSLVSQGHRWLYIRSSSRRNITSHQSDEHQQQRHGHERERVAGRDHE